MLIQKYTVERALVLTPKGPLDIASMLDVSSERISSPVSNSSDAEPYYTNMTLYSEMISLYMVESFIEKKCKKCSTTTVWKDVSICLFYHQGVWIGNPWRQASAML